MEDAVELVLMREDGSRMASRLVWPSTPASALQQWARETCGWVHAPGFLRFRLEGHQAEFGLEGLHGLGDTVVHVVAYMYVPPAAPAAPNQEYKRGRCMASEAKGHKPSTLNQNSAKLMRKGTDSKMVRDVIAARARRDTELESRLEALGCMTKGGSVPMLWGKHTHEEKGSMVDELERRLAACSANSYPRLVLARTLMKAMKNRNAYAKRVSSGGGDVENIPPTGDSNNQEEDALMGGSSGDGPLPQLPPTVEEGNGEQQAPEGTAAPDAGGEESGEHPVLLSDKARRQQGKKPWRGAGSSRKQQR